MPNTMSDIELRKAHVAAWLRNVEEEVAPSVLVPAIRDFREGQAPSPVAIQTIEREIQREERGAPTAPANEWHARNIPNGDYEVTVAGVTYFYRVYLVQSGQLTGQRIIKVRHSDSTVYKGFAFLTRSGNLSLWRRFADDARAPYVQVAAHIFDQMSPRIDIRESSSQPQYVIPPSGTPSDRWVIGVNVRCSVCNQVCNSNNGIVAGLCAEHMPSADRIERERREARLAEQNAWNERARQERERQAAEAAEAARNLRPGRRRNPLPMCEVTRTEVQ